MGLSVSAGPWPRPHAPVHCRPTLPGPLPEEVPMRVAVPRESREGELRVALVPESVKKLAAAGVEVTVERGAGERAYFPDSAYEGAGATIAPDARHLLAAADLVAKVSAPTLDE